MTSPATPTPGAADFGGGAAGDDGEAGEPGDGIDAEADAEAEAERRARNIATWREYLPPDCIETMIRMGWDEST
jgi:hypothetical protein